MDSTYKTRTQSATGSSSLPSVRPRSSLPRTKSSVPDRLRPRGMRFLFELVPCCGSPRKEGERVREAPPAEAPPEGEEGERRRWTGRRRKRRRGAAAAAEWKPSLCAISEDVVVVTVERVGGGGGGGAGERRKKTAADPAPEPERSAASWKTSGGTCARVHDRVFNGDEYDHRRASFQAVIPAFSPAPFMF